MLEHRHSRALRGATTASFATFVALMSHIAAGADVPGPLGIVVPLAIALPICTIVAGRRLSLLGISVSVAISQLLFHALFIFGTVPFALQSGHAHHSMPETAMHGAAAAHEHAHFLFADSPAMMIAHAVAAAITALGLYRGEIALAAILRTGRSALGFARAVLVLVPVPEKPDAPSVPIVTRQRRESATTVLLPVHAYRGPPRSIV
ncbi:MAG TPA: hypothetical protein H9830_01920 [Candidatus Agrococcus pullicola]|uniref:Uncharacterized protein n=1 Tax=Candidatus Agrococcus pullicola TaxID=2838429 RepID=A0A9D1YSJ2_9MICO|nr:hypothetical protein [Candidatus Agrococcus pullicola]